jgi:hypothetical protein
MSRTFSRKSGGLRRISSPLVAINVVENADLDPGRDFRKQ